MENSTNFFDTVLKLSCSVLSVVLIALIAGACGREQYRDNVYSADNRSVLSNSGVSVCIYDDNGCKINNPSDNYNLEVIQSEKSRQVVVSLNDQISVRSSYIEVRFDKTREHPTETETGSALLKHHPITYYGSPEPGMIICAQIIPGASSYQVNGDLLRIVLTAGKHQVRSISGFNQDPIIDPIIADTNIDSGNKNKIYWSFKLRGDGNINLVYDFADFGVIGAKYNKTIAFNPSAEPADANGNGKVDFADFGIVGSNYNQGIGGVKIYSDDTNNPQEVVGTIGTDGKYVGSLTLDPKATSVGDSGFKNYWYVLSTSGRYVKISLLDNKGSEIPVQNRILDTNTSGNGNRGNWWMFGREPTHSHRSSIIGPTTNDLNWTFTVGFSISSTPAIGADGSIYITCQDNQLYSVSKDGKYQWVFKLGNVSSLPAIGSDGTIYVGSINNNLYAINPDGTQKWAYKTSDVIKSCPVIGSDGTIYILGDGVSPTFISQLYALNVDGSLKWKLELGSGTSSNSSSPALSEDGTIYTIGSNNKLYSVYPSGNLKWSKDIPQTTNSSPAIGLDGSIYLGSGTKLLAFKPDGSSKWLYETGGVVNSSPAVGSDGAIYFGSDSDSLYSLDPNGGLNWAYATKDDISSSPAISANGIIYVGSWDKNLYAINPDGTLKWSYATGGIISSSPVIGEDGSVYIGCEDNKLYALGPGTGKTGLFPAANIIASDDLYTDKVNISWSAPSFGPAPDGYYVYRAISSIGSPIYQYLGKTNSLQFNDTFAVPGRTYYYKVQSYKFAGGYNDSPDSVTDTGSRQ